MRSGKSGATSVKTTDFDCPLSQRGVRETHQMGVWLQQQGMVPDWVISSPALRAKSSAENCCKQMIRAANSHVLEQSTGVLFDSTLYEAGTKSFRALLQEIPKSAKRVLIVGHNPGLEAFLCWLTGARVSSSKGGKLLPAAAIAHLSIGGDWAKIGQGKGKLLSITRPQKLANKVISLSNRLLDREPDPSKGISGWLSQQSGVIPYRTRKGRLEVLIISSTKGDRWLFPKGGIEPQWSPQVSAEHEALEEGGVKGKVKKSPLGHYYHYKWGSVCTITLYPMSVTRTLKPSNWSERKRSRRWVSIKQARQQISSNGARNLLSQMKDRVGA